jgi:hypothetical protein
MRKIISKIRVRANDKLTTLKNKIKNKIEVFKEKVNEEKKQPKSKLKSYLLGFGTVLSIFGIAFFSTSLPANANDTPKPGRPKSGQVAPAPVKHSDEIVATLTGAAATLYALAVSSGSFLVGAVCGVVVAVGILKVQGK